MSFFSPIGCAAIALSTTNCPASMLIPLPFPYVHLLHLSLNNSTHKFSEPLQILESSQKLLSLICLQVTCLWRTLLTCLMKCFRGMQFIVLNRIPVSMSSCYGCVTHTMTALCLGYSIITCYNSLCVACIPCLAISLHPLCLLKCSRRNDFTGCKLI